MWSTRFRLFPEQQSMQAAEQQAEERQLAELQQAAWPVGRGLETVAHESPGLLPALREVEN